jgi:uncharacterized NAD(P)/FAD-binding protein YdhS
MPTTQFPPAAPKQPQSAALARDRHVAIIGAGFSGTLQAINLMRHNGPRATLIERHPHPGRGIAYSAADPGHLLNVRAANMSALPDQPDDFVRWLATNHPGMAGFVPRIIYGDYLAALLDRAMATSGGRLAMMRGEAVDIKRGDDGWSVSLDDGRMVQADAVILAPGNLPPHEPPGLDLAALDADTYIANPWATDIADGLRDDDVVLTIGTGLTMIDVALLLDAQGFRGRILALSRRGLLPHAHADPGMGAPLTERPPIVPSNLLRTVRERARTIGWRAAVDALRPFTQDLWLAADPADRTRFLRHLRPWWDIHRHRLAPQIAERIAAMRASGRLDIRGGKLSHIHPLDNAAEVRWRPRGTDTEEVARIRRIVNCSGPQGDLARTAEPLLCSLRDQGLIQPDSQHLGIAVTPQSEAISTDGTARPDLLVLGPMTRGTFWEIVAIPDIRVQTWSVARRLSYAHWVEGEGL